VIVHPSLPGGHVTFCDDIRHEVTGKMTYVGVYNGFMIVGGEMPITIPQICTNIELKLKQSVEPIHPVIKIFKSDEAEPLFTFEADIQPTADPPETVPPVGMDIDALRFMKLSVEGPLQNVVITNSCALKVRAYIGEDEIRLGALQILVAPLETIDEVSPN
jgi:hypothetical protein